MTWPTPNYAIREIVNRNGVVYDADKLTVLFAEDLLELANEIKTLENDLIAEYINTSTKKIKSRDFDKLNFGPNDVVLPASGAPTIVVTDGSAITYKTINFADSATQSVFFQMRAPKGLKTGSMTIKIDYLLGSTTDANIYDAIAYRLNNDNRVFDAALSEFTPLEARAYGSATHSAGDLYQAVYTKTGLLIAPGDLLTFRYRRNAVSSNDTVGETVKILNFVAQFTSDI